MRRRAPGSGGWRPACGTRRHRIARPPASWASGGHSGPRAASARRQSARNLNTQTERRQITSQRLASPQVLSPAPPEFTHQASRA
eukprot:CAMPEP_0206003214 /NCGR_PEP_ID=MMETSP1464-20131121/3235_1 /ASSEMBLY_ACC=CAM_ASM_001124 /TAXON_ID=119497 /ORGANISM="Exanthemachrysis gayraliae, Strain RCC1523" /LENGTH=84 /DNA_ID=CAMNT_0053376577 /DNA_START=112 /DNA_END=366 /DNA_ORIENTATION=-